MIKICPNCKTSLTEYLEKGLLGCEKCYETFNEEIQRFLRVYEAGNYHIGNPPLYSEDEIALMKEYQDLLLKTDLSPYLKKENEVKIAELKKILSLRGLL